MYFLIRKFFLYFFIKNKALHETIIDQKYNSLISTNKSDNNIGIERKGKLKIYTFILYFIIL